MCATSKYRIGKPKIKRHYLLTLTAQEGSSGLAGQQIAVYRIRKPWRVLPVCNRELLLSHGFVMR
jgi:hypothetical protein